MSEKATSSSRMRPTVSVSHQDPSSTVVAPMPSSSSPNRQHLPRSPLGPRFNPTKQLNSLTLPEPAAPLRPLSKSLIKDEAAAPLDLRPRSKSLDLTVLAAIPRMDAMGESNAAFGLIRLVHGRRVDD